MNDEDSSVNRLGTTSSGLTLVLPSLKALKELNAKKKSSPSLESTPVKKYARPIKLKPLKEVLTSLITKIKKWAFKTLWPFVQNTNFSPNFFWSGKTTMLSFSNRSTSRRCLGTWTSSHSRWISARWRGRSQSRSTDPWTNLPYVPLAGFHLTRSPSLRRRLSISIYSQEDFRLVISNAKTFNPLGTIYHTEAERIEAWASDHISKAASCVIEYETEWNIDVDRDEDVNVDADDDAAGGAAGSVGPDTPARRSPSVLSASAPPINRRGGKNAAAKKEGMLSETVEPDGHLPGFKDGVGVFPPGSDWAEVMLALKLKGMV